MVLSNILRKFFSLLINIVVSVLSIFIWRDKKIWLFGAWMGTKFCDNARFLFQYVHNNKEALDIKKVIWVTRNHDVYKRLIDEGYNAYLIGTFTSFYWHLKAGVHIVSNLGAPSSGHRADIDGYLSATAFKLQLWHGVGIKACSILSNKNIKANYSHIKRILLKATSSAWFTPGKWEGCYWIATSEENARALGADFNINRDRFIIGNYARNSDTFILSKKESDVIDELERYKKNGYIVALYLPTFRNDTSEYVNPTDAESFINFLHTLPIIWVEKRHLASTFKKESAQDSRVIYLESDFDVNTLYQHASVIISDYSSVTSDAVLRHIPTIDYIPDYEHYNSDDRGFVNEYSKYHPGIQTKTVEELCDALVIVSDRSYFSSQIEKSYLDTKELLFENHPRDIEWLIKQIKIKVYNLSNNK